MINDYEIKKITKNKYQLILYYGNEERSIGYIISKIDLYGLFSQLRTMFKDVQNG